MSIQLVLSVFIPDSFRSPVILQSKLMQLFHPVFAEVGYSLKQLQLITGMIFPAVALWRN